MISTIHSLVIFQVSRAQILKKAADYITYMRRKNHTHQQDIEELKRHNTVLEQQSMLSFLLLLEVPEGEGNC